MDQTDVKKVVSILPVFGIDSNNKQEALETMISELKNHHYITDEKGFEKDVYQRESEMATYIGHGIGLPHSQSKFVTHPAVAIGRLKKPIVWSGNDKVNLIFMIAVPREARGNLHLKILANLSRMLIHDDFREKLKTASPEQVIEMMDDHMIRS